MTATSRLRCVFEALYHEMGRRAPGLGDDAYVVRTYEAARAFGDVAGSWPASPADESDAAYLAVRDVLARAYDEDASGGLGLFVVASVIAPRLIVTLRDARESVGEDDGIGASRLDAGTDTVIREVQAIYALVDEAASGQYGEIARQLASELDERGFAGDFGPVA